MHYSNCSEEELTKCLTNDREVGIQNLSPILLLKGSSVFLFTVHLTSLFSTFKNAFGFYNKGHVSNIVPGNKCPTLVWDVDSEGGCDSNPPKNIFSLLEI